MSETEEMPFPDWLTKRLAARGFTPERLAAATGGEVSASLIYRWRRGTITPNPANLRKIAGPLGVDYVSLLLRVYSRPGDDRPPIVDNDPPMPLEAAIRRSDLRAEQKQAMLAVLGQFRAIPA